MAWKPLINHFLTIKVHKKITENYQSVVIRQMEKLDKLRKSMEWYAEPQDIEKIINEDNTS